MANRKEEEENPGRLNRVKSFETEFLEHSKTKVDPVVLILLSNLNEARG